MSDKKSISKSIRMTEDTYKYINTFSGSGFNAKIETMVYRLQREQKTLDEKVKQKQKELAVLDKQIEEKRHIVSALRSITYYVERLIGEKEAAERKIAKGE